MGKPPHVKMVNPPNGFARPLVLTYPQKRRFAGTEVLEEEARVETFLMVTLVVLRVSVPLALTLWVSSRLRAWDRRRTA